MRKIEVLTRKKFLIILKCIFKYSLRNTSKSFNGTLQMIISRTKGMIKKSRVKSSARLSKLFQQQALGQQIIRFK